MRRVPESGSAAGKSTRYSLPRLNAAAHTARIVSQLTDFPKPIVEELLTELETGPFTGHSFSEIAGIFPEQWLRFRELSWEGVEGAETIAEISARAHAYWEKLIELAETGKRHILSVTHSGFLQWIIKTANGADTAWMPLYSIANCGNFSALCQPSPHGRRRHQAFFNELLRAVETDQSHSVLKLLTHSHFSGRRGDRRPVLSSRNTFYLSIRFFNASSQRPYASRYASAFAASGSTFSRASSPINASSTVP